MIWIAIREERLMTYENRNISSYIKDNKLEIKYLDLRNINIKIDNNQILIIYYNGIEIDKPNKIYTKIGCVLNEYEIDLLTILQDYGINIINETNLLNLVANKMLTVNKLIKNNIKTIPTITFLGRNAKASTIESTFDFPIIIKSKKGSLGMGIYLLETQKELKNMLEQIKLLDGNYNFLIQEYVKEGSTTYRAMCFDGIIKYVIKYTTDKKETFKSNFTMGASAELVTIDKKIEKIVKKIYEIIPLAVMGIDFFLVEDEYIVCEINSNPGYKGYDQVSGNRFTENLINFLKMK